MRTPKTMRIGRLTLLSAFLASAALPALAFTHAHRGPTSPRLLTRHAAARPHTQASIDDQRATQIQSALIKSGYLNGAPSGHWDSQTEAAMQKLQADNGWQTKLVPDSRAIIKLGLGPDNGGGSADTIVSQR